MCSSSQKCHNVSAAMELLGQSKADIHRKDELKNCDETNGTQGQRSHAIHSDDFLEKLENIFNEKSPHCNEFN